MIDDSYPRHGLKNKTKSLVFDALFLRQQGKCFICGRSQAELEAKARAWGLSDTDYIRNTVHWKLHIDHCHTTGMIRGLLCERCNVKLGFLENYGFRQKPARMLDVNYGYMCENVGPWLEENLAMVLVYMQPSRWLPRKDILVHLQTEP